MAASSDPTKVTSPKVTGAAVGGSLVFLALTLLIFVLDSADASWFQGAFDQNPALVSVVVGICTTAAAVIRGWKVADPLRENYLAQMQAVESSRSNHPSTGNGIGGPEMNHTPRPCYEEGDVTG